ncbi:hypothetical protein ACRW7V_27125, partial [Escherichia coli]
MLTFLVSVDSGFQGIDEADRLLQLNINLLRQMVEEPDVLSDSKNENRLLFDKQKALKRIEELEGEQIK